MRSRRSKQTPGRGRASDCAPGVDKQNNFKLIKKRMQKCVFKCASARNVDNKDRRKREEEEEER